MNGLLFVFQKIWKFLVIFRKYLPKSFAGLFIISTFFSNLFQESFEFAIRELALSILSAELVINKNVNLALQNSPEYTLGSFFEIIVSFMIVYYLIKYITKLFTHIAGSQALWGSMFLASIMVILIEYVGVVILLGDFSFIPIWDGVLFFSLNIQPVLLHIHYFSFSFASVIDLFSTNTTNATNSAVNSTVQNISKLNN